MAVVLAVGSVQADVLSVDVSQVDARYRSAFQNAERFWESRIIGYSDKLPTVVRSQLSRLQIVASTPAIDGAGGILGQAAPTATVTYGGFNGFPRGGNSLRIAIATQATMQFDIDDMAGLQAAGNLESVVRHEMAHAMGFGSLWNGNGLLAVGFNGQQNYVGNFGLTAYRKESGQTLSPLVPVEQGGGAGTALAHWDDDDPFFNNSRTGKTEGMLGTIDAFNPNVRTFWSETTWHQFADLWFKVRGVDGVPFTDLVFGGGGNVPIRPITPWTPRGPGGGVFGGGLGGGIGGGGSGGIISFMRSVPEPSSLSLLVLGSVLVLARRRK
jgi:hypothetical protein